MSDKENLRLWDLRKICVCEILRKFVSSETAWWDVLSFSFKMIIEITLPTELKIEVLHFVIGDCKV